MKLLKTKEVAGLTRLPEGTLRYFRHSNQGPAWFYVGKRNVVYREDAVISWLADQEAATAARRSA